MRRVAPLAFVLLLLVPAAAAGQTSVEVASEVDATGFYVERGVPVSDAAMANLAERYPNVGFVALGDTPAGGPDAFADDVLTRIPELDVVLVLTETEGGVSSQIHADSEIDAALDSALAAGGDTYEQDFEDLARALGAGSNDEPPSDSVPPADSEADAGGGFPGGWIVLLVAVGGLGLILWRNRRRDRETVEQRLEAAKAEIREQLTAIADQILEFSDRVDSVDHPEAVDHFRRANETYQHAEERLEQASTGALLEELSDELDLARWELAAAAAIVEGRPVPERPADEVPEPCFFDPTHGTGVEEAQLRTPAGVKTVKVCLPDAERLRRGDRPEPRTIEVDGRRVPAPQAPRSHGGRGFGWLDAFSILVGGMSDAAGYRWPRPRPRPRGVPRGGGSGLPFPRRRTRPPARGRGSRSRSGARRGSGRRSR